MLITGNTKDELPVLIELAGGTSVTEESKQVVLGVMGIHCADRTVRVSKFDDFLPVVDQLYKTSKLIGDVTSAISMICAQWKMSAKEVYTGDFHAKTKKPVLFMAIRAMALLPSPLSTMLVLDSRTVLCWRSTATVYVPDALLDGLQF
jgi:hypothetical protein